MARKIIGITFIVAAVFGLIFSLAGIVLVWTVKAPLTTYLVNTIDLVDTTLEATITGLSVTDETLTKAISDLTTLENTIQTASTAVDDTVPMVDTITGLLSGGIPDAIKATQTGLTSLQSAAASIESTLELLTSIPFIPIENYAPEVPFTDAIDNVSTSLDSIPESLADMETTLNTTQGNLTMIAAQTRIISRNLGDLKSSLYDIQLVIDKYMDVITTAQEKVDSIRSNLSTLITVTVWLFTIIFIWLGIAQLGLLTQGLERVDWPPSHENNDNNSTPDNESKSSQKGELLNSSEGERDG